MTADQPPPAASAPRLDTGTRLSDWLNPILVREVQQALNGKVFLITLSLALLAVLVIAVAAVASYRDEREIGGPVFVGTMVAMAPILVFAVPFQAFLSMRQEVSGGTAELLMLTHLTPRRIVFGKVAASMVHFVLYFGVFAPLLALTFLLRGVDVPMILVGLVLAGQICLVATAMAVALGALCRWKMITASVWGLATLALGGATVLVMTGGGYFLGGMSRWMRDAWFWQALAAWVLALGYALYLFVCVARAMLTHPYENRSTPFRVWALVFTPLALAFAIAVSDRGSLWEVTSVVSVAGLLVLTAVGLFAVTEDDRLSPRLTTLVPARRGAALVRAPFLPGGARGYLFVLLGAALIGTLWAILAAVLGLTGRPRYGTPVLFLAYAGLYCLFYLSLARILRARLRPGLIGTWVARCVMPLVFLFLILVPLALDALIHDRVRETRMIHLLNPFFMMDRIHDEPEAKLLALALLTGFLLLSRIGDLRRGLAEVLGASAARGATEPGRAA